MRGHGGADGAVRGGAARGARLDLRRSPGPADVAVQWLLTSFVDGRAAPLFGLLFGYGLVQMTRRLTGPDSDPAGARRLIRRRVCLRVRRVGRDRRVPRGR